MYETIQKPMEDAVDNFLGCDRRRSLKEMRLTVAHEIAQAAVDEVGGGRRRLAAQLDTAQDSKAVTHSIVARAVLRGQEMLKELIDLLKSPAYARVLTMQPHLPPL